MFLKLESVTWESGLYLISLCFRSAFAYTGAKSNQPKFHRYPNNLAAAARQAEPRSVVSIQAFLPDSRGQCCHLCGDTSEQYRIPPGEPAARHNLSPAHGCSHPRGLV